MKKILKNLTTAALSFLLSVSAIGSTNAFADKAILENTVVNYELSSVQKITDDFVNAFPYMQEEIYETVEIVAGTPSYKSAFEYDENSAYELLRSSLNNLVSHSGASTYGADYKGCFYANYTVPFVKQSTKYNCGIAAALQAVIGNGYLANTAANKSANKLSELAGYVSYNEKGTSGAQAWQVRNIMNHYKTGIYDAVCITRYNVDYIISDMGYSFEKGYCPIITLNDTSELSYYEGASYSHWVTISRIDDINKTITVVDPFNSDLFVNTPSNYGGSHTVPYDEFLEAIGVGGDCWVILKTTHPDWAA